MQWVLSDFLLCAQTCDPKTAEYALPSPPVSLFLLHFFHYACFSSWMCRVLDEGSEPAYILLKVQMDLNEQHLHLGQERARSLVQREEDSRFKFEFCLYFFSPTLKAEQQALQTQHIMPDIIPLVHQDNGLCHSVLYPVPQGGLLFPIQHSSRPRAQSVPLLLVVAVPDCEVSSIQRIHISLWCCHTCTRQCYATSAHGAVGALL